MPNTPTLELAPAPFGRKLIDKGTIYTKILHNNDKGGFFLSVKNPVTEDVLYVSIGLTDKELAERLRKIRIRERMISDYFTHDSNRYAAGRCTTTTAGRILVRVVGTLTGIEELGTLTHELLHATHRIIGNAEKTLIFDAKEETMCCLQDFLQTQILAAIKPTLYFYRDLRMKWDDVWYLESNFNKYRLKGEEEWKTPNFSPEQMGDASESKPSTETRGSV